MPTFDCPTPPSTIGPSMAFLHLRAFHFPEVCLQHQMKRQFKPSWSFREGFILAFPCKSSIPPKVPTIPIASHVDLKPIILKTAVGREKAVQAIDVHREFKNCVVTFWVMSQFFNFLGASRDCADFRDPTAVFRIMGKTVAFRLQKCSDKVPQESQAVLSPREITHYEYTIPQQ